MNPMRFHTRSLLFILLFATGFLTACAGGSSKSTVAQERPSAEDSVTSETASSMPDRMRVSEQMHAAAEAVAPDQPTYLARKVAVHPDETLIPLTSEVITELDPNARFSLGLDRYVRQDFQPLNHRRVLVATSRLALDSEGNHLLQTLLPSRKPIVRRVVLFNDELPAPARTTEMDRIMAAYPDVRVFERTPRNFRLTPAMLEEIDVILIDLSMRGGQFYPENGFLCGLLQDAALNGKNVILLDRPIPVTGVVYDGPVSEAGLYGTAEHFYPMMTMMGLTTGELALFINQHYGLGAELEVIRMEQWPRDAGYSRMLQSYQRLGINPAARYEEWEHYIPASTVAGQLQAIGALLPAGKTISANAEGLVIDPAPLSPEQFVETFKTYQASQIVAAPAEVTVDNQPGQLVRLTASEPILEPVYTAVALWAVWAKASPEILPAAGNGGPFGSFLIIEGLRAGRHPRDLQRTWRSQAVFSELENRRKRVLIY